MKFSDLRLSQKTINGLNHANYTTLTPIQEQTIHLAIKRTDILACAETGSGKTLAFIIPILEGLLECNWGPLDGLGALLITPTRELALQIFNELRKVGKYHTFSAGLIIGGKDLEAERDRVGQMNILVFEI
jgi:ATP-dependent RNA helicase DDX10/DBP4